jgi:hypothetical protein
MTRAGSTVMWCLLIFVGVVATGGRHALMLRVAVLGGREKNCVYNLEINKWWPQIATMIPGRRSGLSRCVCSHQFNLQCGGLCRDCRRHPVFFLPKWFSPGGDEIGRRCNSSAGGSEGPNRFSCFLLRVICANS